MTLFKRTVWILFFGWAWCFPQTPADSPEKALEYIRNGRIEDARSIFPSLQKKYPGSEAVMFLDACFEPNGNVALQKYNLFLDRFSSGSLAPLALYRIYQYYYAKGLYITAQKTGETLLEKYPGSPFESQLRGEVKADAVEQAVTTGENEEDTITSSMIYTVQVGSFQDPTNAERQKFQLHDIGYTVSIAEKLVDGVKFYSVLVGEFRNVDEALQCGKVLKEKLQLSYRVIEKQESK